MARVPEKANNHSASQEIPNLFKELQGLVPYPPVPTTSKSTQFI